MIFLTYFVVMAVAFLACFKIFAEAMLEKQSPEGINTKLVDEYREIQRIKDYDEQMARLSSWREKVMSLEQKRSGNVIELSEFVSSASRKTS